MLMLGKKKVAIITISLIILLGGGFIFQLSGETILSGKIDSIKLIRYTYYDQKTGKASSQIEINSDNDIQRLMSPLTYPLHKLRTKTIKHPSHEKGLHFDWDAEMTIHYNDGTADKLIITKLAVYRFLDSYGRGGDQGYTRLNNDRYYAEYLFGLKE